MGNQRDRAVGRLRNAAPWIVGLGLALAVNAAEVDNENRIVLTIEEQIACVRGGGCVVLPRALVRQMIDMLERCERKGLI